MQIEREREQALLTFCLHCACDQLKELFHVEFFCSKQQLISSTAEPSSENTLGDRRSKEPNIMENIADSILLLILKELNLNQRAKFRLINKRCKALLDSIQIKKLVVFERLPPLPPSRPLDYLAEAYDLKDTVQVYDLGKFFGNHVLLKQMRSLEILVIRGIEEQAMSLKSQFELNTVFEQLNYLSLHHVLLTSGQVLRSPKLKHLILDGCALRSKEQIHAKIEELKSRQDPSDDSSLSVFMYALEELSSRDLRSLKITLETEYCLYLYLKRNELLRSIEELDVVISDFDLTFEFIVNNFVSLKRLHCLIGTETSTLLEKAEAVHLERLAGKLRDDLCVFICGIPFRRSDALLVIEFLKTAGDMVTIENAKLEFTGFSATYQMLNKFETRTDLTHFCKKIDRFKVHDTRILNNKLFARLSNCQALDLALHHNAKPLTNFFEAFPAIKAIRISCFDWLVKIGNELDQLPLHCGQVEQLSFDNWNNKKLNFNFLFKLKRLRMLACYQYLPMDQTVFLLLIKVLKHLECIDVCFIRPTDLKDEQLSAFKRSVVDCATEKLKIPPTDHFMKIQKFHRQKINKQFVRYLYKRGRSMQKHQESETEWREKLNTNKMFMLADYRKQIDEEMSRRMARL